MIYQTVNFADFCDAFHRFGRQNQFSEQGLRILFDYLEQYADEGWELDVIALCCDFVEMPESEVRENYPIAPDESVEDYLQDNTIICGKFESGETVYLFQQF